MGKNKSGWKGDGWKNSKNRPAGSGTVTPARRARYQEKCRKRDADAAALDVSSLDKSEETSTSGTRTSLDKSEEAKSTSGTRTSLDKSEATSSADAYSMFQEVKGFQWADLNTRYQKDIVLTIGGKPTYWNQDRRFFFYYQKSLRRWALSVFDLDATEEDMLLHAQRGGTRGIACQIGGEGSSKWLEYMQASDTWLRANIEVLPG